jgi:hypothetical protein
VLQPVAHALASQAAMHGGMQVGLAVVPLVRTETRLDYPILC